MLYLHLRALHEKYNIECEEQYAAAENYKELGQEKMCDMALGKALAYSKIVGDIERLMVKHIIEGEKEDGVCERKSGYTPVKAG